MTDNPFDAKAATWDDDPAKVARAALVAEKVRGVVPLDRNVRVLEYGAGTGLVSEALHSLVGPITLVDSSAGMRAVMASKVEAGSLAGAKIWDVDLAVAVPPDERFDLVVTVLTLHHIEQLEPVLRAFATLLEPGGCLCIVDLEEEDGSFHSDEFHGHHGFERGHLGAQLRNNGFTDARFEACGQLEKNGRQYPMFLAVAARHTT